MEKKKEAAGGIPLALSVTALRFDGAGSGTREQFRYAARYTEADGECRLSYEETAAENEGSTPAQNEGGDLSQRAGRDPARPVTKTVLSFKKGTPCVVKLEKSGEIHTEMHFAPGETFSAVYAVSGLGSFAAEGTARRVENTLTAAGGRISLDYDLTLGGVRARTVLTVTATKSAEKQEGAAGMQEEGENTSCR